MHLASVRPRGRLTLHLGLFGSARIFIYILYLITTMLVFVLWHLLILQLARLHQDYAFEFEYWSQFRRIQVHSAARLDLICVFGVAGVLVGVIVTLFLYLVHISIALYVFLHNCSHSLFIRAVVAAQILVQESAQFAYAVPQISQQCRVRPEVLLGMIQTPFASVTTLQLRLRGVPLEHGLESLAIVLEPKCLGPAIRRFIQ